MIKSSKARRATGFEKCVDSRDNGCKISIDIEHSIPL